MGPSFRTIDICNAFYTSILCCCVVLYDDEQDTKSCRRFRCSNKSVIEIFQKFRSALRRRNSELVGTKTTTVNHTTSYYAYPYHVIIRADIGMQIIGNIRLVAIKTCFSMLLIWALLLNFVSFNQEEPPVKMLRIMHDVCMVDQAVLARGKKYSDVFTALSRSFLKVSSFYI